MPEKILIAVDASDESLRAAEYAIAMAARLEAELSALHVVVIPEYVSADVRHRLEGELKLRGESALRRAREAAQAKAVPLHEQILTTTKSVVAAICTAAAHEGAGLIVLGTRGEGGVAKLMLGSVAAGVVREAPCPVLVVR